MASTSNLQIVPLVKSVHDRAGFDCGVDALNRYLREQAMQDIKRRVAGCWVLTATAEPQAVLGYYTLSPEAVDIGEVKNVSPASIARLPRYPRLGAVLLGRLAVARSEKGNGLGKLLLQDATLRALHAEIPPIIMVTDPKDEKAEAFYTKFGFERLSATRLFTTVQRIADTLGNRDSHR